MTGCFETHVLAFAPPQTPAKVATRHTKIRHLEGLVLKAKVHSAQVPDQDGLRLLLESARTGLSRVKHLWLDGGTGEGGGRRK